MVSILAEIVTALVAFFSILSGYFYYNHKKTPVPPPPPPTMATLTGQVVDTTNGKPIPSATVSLVGDGVTNTNSTGNFTLLQVSFGSYTVNASANGFQDSSFAYNFTSNSAPLQISLLPTPPPPPVQVPPPSSGLGSNSNYLIYDDCNNILYPSITIEVTEALNTNNGFSFQWNMDSPQNETCSYQQYVIGLPPNSTQMYCAVDNWPISGNNLVNEFIELCTLPSAVIPVGYKFKMSLTCDTSENVTGCVYSVIDNTGKVLGTKTITISQLPSTSFPSGAFQASYLSPVSVITMNIVGPYNSEATVFSTGAGKITTSCNIALTALNSLPPCTETTAITAETSNEIYGTLPALPSTSLVQTFSTNTAAMITKLGPKRRRTPFRTPRKI